MTNTQRGAVYIALAMLVATLIVWISGGSDRAITGLVSVTGLLLLGWFGLSYVMTHVGRK